MARTTSLIFGALIIAVAIGWSIGFSVGHQLSSANHLQPNSANAMVFAKASIPVKLFRCITRLNIMRCLQVFMLQRMERTPMVNSGNLTADFLDRILSSEDTDEQHNLWDSELASLSDVRLNARLQNAFQAFFSNREIKLYFIPGLVVKVVPTVENYLNFTVKKNKPEAESIGMGRSKKQTKDEEGPVGNGKRKPNKTAEYALQLGVPALMMPAILLGSVLPYLLPALKMATILSLLINKGALITAALYATKHNFIDHDKLIYSPSPSYHRDLSNM